MAEKTAEQIALEKQRERLTKRFHKACADYGLLADGDHVLIGLSGGKDSLALVELLGRRAKIYKPRFRVTALHVRVKERDYRTDLSYLERFCAEAGVPLLVRDVEITNERVKELTNERVKELTSEGVKELTNERVKELTSEGVKELTNERVKELTSEGVKELTNERVKEANPCFLCSWYRRKTLFNVAQELGCNKIAFGHHKDDVVQTLLMNLVFAGSFATMPPLLQLEKMPLQIIRPLCLIEEADLVKYAAMRGYEKQQKLCPFEHVSARTQAKELLEQMKQLNPEALGTIYAAMSNVKFEYLPQVKELGS